MIFFIAKKILRLLAKLSSKNKYEFSSDMSDEDAVRNIGYLAHRLRKTVKSGAGVPKYAIKLAISQAAKIIAKKKQIGRKVYDFEEWLFDNHRLLIGTLEAIKLKEFTRLPHVDGLPRIVILADFIVKYSGGKVTRDRVQTIVEAFNAVTPLGYNEILALKDALYYRLLAEISYFAERSLHYFASYRRAVSDVFYQKYKSSDSYLTYFAELHPEESVLGLDRNEFQTAQLGFENLLADSLLLTSAYIDSLRCVGSEISEVFIVGLSSADMIYQKEDTYRSMSVQAKNDYLTQTAKCAENNNVSEQALARACLSLAECLNVHFGEILFYYPDAIRKFLRTGVAEPLRDEKTKVQGVYAFLVLFISLIIAAFPSYYLRNLWAYLSVLPLFISVLHPVEYMLKRTYSFRLKKKPLPQMDYKILPEECRTVVVTSRFFTSHADVDHALFQAETLAADMKDPSVHYVVLADLPSSDTAWGKDDEEILSYIKSCRISDRISVFLRKRVKAGGKWRGYERKRGAILELFEAIKEENTEKFFVIGNLPKAEFAVLMDDDSEVLPGTIRSAILAMAHPLNREYDLLSFGGRINRFSLKTNYSLRYLRGCGTECYPFYSDFYADAFDCALYCGKAIVRISPYLKKLRYFFQDGRVLSHDIIEGAVLRSTSLKRCVYEDAPASFPAEYRRLSRWQRGDVQLLPFAFCNRVKNRLGQRVKNPIEPIYKLIIFINGVSVLRDFMSLTVALFGLLTGEYFLLYYALSCCLFVKTYALISSIGVFFQNVRLSHAVRVFIYSLEVLAEEAVMIVFRAISDVYLFCVTCFKMAVRSDSLLDWTPFRSTQSQNGAVDGAKILLPTVVLLSALCLLVGNLWITVYSAVFFLYAFYLLFSGKNMQTRPIAKTDQQQLKVYAQKIYRYFSDMSSDDLIVDNVQLFPYRMYAKMTSPTNLGFALLAEVCACKIDLVDKQLAFDNIRKHMDKIKGLETHFGHLYNWYDVKTKEVMTPKVVSTVDSANFLACLSVVAAFAREEKQTDISTAAEEIIKKADFSALYDDRQKCLAIIKQTDENRLYGRYDLLASEARLAYYFAISQGIDPECYFLLGRDCTSQFGNTLLSWSGTAFEYMLPRLFMRAPIGSLIAEQEERSAKVQLNDVSEGVFGRSECGYYAFNDATAYLYKAVGCRQLALSGESADVIAPYATFLYLPCCPKPCLQNLQNLSCLRMEGEYGFFEALDFEHGGDIVQSYMTHHQGMSLAAITNLLCNDEIVRLFASSPRMNSVRLLLSEDNIYERKPKYIPKMMLTGKIAPEVCCKPKEIPDTLVLRCGEYRATYDALGRSGASLGTYQITKATDYREEYGGLFLQIKEGDNSYSPAYYPFGAQECYALFNDHSVKYLNPNKGVTMEVSPLSGYNGERRKILLENPTGQEKSVTISAFSSAVLNTKDAYDSHPAFSDMFVSAEADESTGTQYLYRKNTDCKISFAASLSVKGLTDVKMNCNAYNVIGRHGNIADDISVGVARNDAPAFGDVLYPCFGVSGHTVLPPHGKATVYFCLLADKDFSLLKERNRKLDLAYRAGALELLGKAKTEANDYLALQLSVTGKLLYERTSQSVLSARLSMRNELTALGISPDHDILYFDHREDGDDAKLSAVAMLSKTLSENGFLIKTVIICDNLSGAGMDAVSALKKRLASFGDSLLILDRAQAEGLCDCAKIILSKQLKEQDGLVKKSPYLLPQEDARTAPLIPCGEGGFSQTGYSVFPFYKHTLLPYANVVGAKFGGFLITENGGGFSFGENAREDKLSVWTGDAVLDAPTEAVCLSIGDKNYLLNRNHCEHQVGASIFTHLFDGVTIRLSVSLFNEGKSKLYEVLFTEELPDGVLSFGIIPALGWRFSENVLIKKVENGVEFINENTQKKAYLFSPNGMLSPKIPQTKAGMIWFSLSSPVKKGFYRFVLSTEKPQPVEEHAFTASKAKCLSQVFSNAVTVKSGNVFLDLLNNAVLPYQLTSARLNAKTGFYQCSGAFGFRDQLQDVLGLLLSDPTRVKQQILLCAEHQYSEGDVQHWWHPPKTGVRTRISDDRLWLVYVSERYIEVTGDICILDQNVSFLSSPILNDGEVSRYEIPRDGDAAPLSEHLLRAIRISLSYGEHGLLKIGSGDWNDGLDRVGVKGRGESVWLTMFAYRVIKDALNYFKESVRSELSTHLEKLSAALLPLLKNKRYPLAFTDDGTWLGTAEQTVCNLALNPQTWAVISGAVPIDDAKRALSSVSELVDVNSGIIKLSSPPFNAGANYGYVAAYPKGIRENGGQYTHAAVWYLKALLQTGQNDEAYKILCALNPMARCQNKEGAKIYMGEPYVLAGDVYGAEPYRGRAGWTWYTGSAAWLKYVLTEDFFGIRKRGDKLYIRPCFPSSFEKLSARISLKNVIVNVQYEKGKETGLFLNGKHIEHLDLSETKGEVYLLCRF